MEAIMGNDSVEKICKLLFEYLKDIIYDPDNAKIDTELIPSEFSELTEGMTFLLGCINELKELGVELSKGKLNVNLPNVENNLAGSLKAIHGTFSHLIWLMNRVTDGDFNQRLYHMNELSESFNAMVDKLMEAAIKDKLTGLYNYNGFEQLASEFLKNTDRKYFIITLDINNFKRFNELNGRKNGDDFLIKTAGFLSELCGEGELAARIYSDYFACLLTGSNTKTVKKRIVNAYETGLGEQLFKRNLYSLKVGIFDTKDSRFAIRQMLDCAKLAMQQHRLFGEITAGIYNESLHLKHVKENGMIAGFEKAMYDNEFYVEYQPKFNLFTQRIVGAEALARWNRAGKIIKPPEFIPVFESNGLIEALDYYVLDKVCSEMRAYIDAGSKPVPVSVNLSKAHFYDPTFVDKFMKILEQWKIPPRMIEVEISETSFSDNVSLIIETLKEIRTRGIKVSIGNFGSGLSSLNLLKKVDIDFLKISREFFEDFDSDIRSRQIVMMLLKMTNEVNLSTVAEGVETPGQLDFLKQNGCNLVQGFFFSRTLSNEKYYRLLSADI